MPHALSPAFFQMVRVLECLRCGFPRFAFSQVRSDSFVVEVLSFSRRSSKCSNLLFPTFSKRSSRFFVFVVLYLFFLFLLFCTLSLRPGAALRDSLRIALLQNQWNQPNRRNRPWKKPVKRPQAQAVHTISWHHIDIHIALACITSHY